ncbi:hypothetical protein TNCV_2664371 [Trichonephila clavipes]|nr:hypothetical protein TNCV_2664371 [Trichonephila clavipes]
MHYTRRKNSNRFRETGWSNIWRGMSAAPAKMRKTVTNKGRYRANKQCQKFRPISGVVDENVLDDHPDLRYR